MKSCLLLVIVAVLLQATPSSWLATVAPIMSPSERKVYLSLNADAQEKFRSEFWVDKQITAEEYYRRLQYVDATYGSTKIASGANTDPGRVYLALGAPNRITRIPSSRIFVPIEIWYYETVPAINLNTELRIIFYQKNALGLLKLYSPTLDSVRALLLPQSSTVGMFGPNDNITESDIRKNLTVGPVEDEVLSSAVSVAAGITATGNDEILSQIMSPELLLHRSANTEVKSKLVFFRPKLDMLVTPSQFGGSQVDFRLETDLRSELELQVEQGGIPVYRNRVHFTFEQRNPVAYMHRLDLLPGSYTVLFSVDGQAYPYHLEVSETPKISGIVRVTPQDLQSGEHAPFEFDGSQFKWDPQGDFALLPISEPAPVTWVLRRGFEVILKTTVQARQAAKWYVPIDLPAGPYKLEASCGGGSYQMDLFVKATDAAPNRAVISYNANLAPALRYAAIGHQWLMHGKLAEARRSLQLSLQLSHNEAAEVELARADALDGNLDTARDRVRRVLAREPKNFEALSVFAYVETKFQDYAVAASLYRRALALQDSPALRQALASLPVN